LERLRFEAEVLELDKQASAELKTADDVHHDELRDSTDSKLNGSRNQDQELLDLLKDYNPE
jgi:hypothetical protein